MSQKRLFLRLLFIFERHIYLNLRTTYHRKSFRINNPQKIKLFAPSLTLRIVVFP